MKNFVIVVDTQWDFMAPQGALSVPEAADLIAPMCRWLAALVPDETAGVLFTFDTHLEEIYGQSNEAKVFPMHCVRGTAGWANVLEPALVDPFIPKWRMEKGVFDMWAEEGLTIVPINKDGDETPRDQFFANLFSSDITDVVVIGVAADYCVRWAIEGLLERGFHVTVPATLTRGIERQIDAVAGQDFAGKALFLS